MSRAALDRKWRSTPPVNVEAKKKYEKGPSRAGDSGFPRARCGLDYRFTNSGR